jgi:hypothetical protein
MWCTLQAVATGSHWHLLPQRETVVHYGEPHVKHTPACRKPAMSSDDGFPDLYLSSHLTLQAQYGHRAPLRLRLLPAQCASEVCYTVLTQLRCKRTAGTKGVCLV